jgi:hypothetical protein
VRPLWPACFKHHKVIFITSSQGGVPFELWSSSPRLYEEHERRNSKGTSSEECPFICCLFNDALNNSDYVAPRRRAISQKSEKIARVIKISWQWTSFQQQQQQNWKVSGRKRLWPNLRYCSSIFWKRPRDEGSEYPVAYLRFYPCVSDYEGWVVPMWPLTSVPDSQPLKADFFKIMYKIQFLPHRKNVRFPLQKIIG